MPWNDPLSIAAATFLGQEVLRFLLQTILAYPYSTSLFVTYYEEGLYFSIAYFAFHGVHFGRSPFCASSVDLPQY
jgi:hypothetical protein